MSDITTLLYQFLKTKFGDLDWDNGSVLRELVAEPVVTLAEMATQAINTAYNAINISALLQAPEENAEAIDQLFDYLGLTATAPRASIGSVRLLTSSAADFIIPAGASFTYGDTVLTVVKQYNVKLNTRNDNTLPLTSVGYDAYEVIVPVEGPVTGTSLSAGSALIWNLANNDIYSATVYSTITGNSSEYTATQKINQIRQYLYPTSLTCAEGFLKTINNYSEGLAVDCSVSTQYPATGITLYVKTAQGPGVWRIPVKGTPVDGGYQANISAIGVSRVRSVIGGTLESVAWSGRSATIVWSGDTSEVAVEVAGLKDLIDAQTAIDRYTDNTGIRVDVKPPRLLLLSMYLPTTAVSISTEAVNQVVSAVNNSLLNAAGLGDHTTVPILSAAGVSLQGAGTYTLEDIFSGNKQTSLATVNTTPFTAASEPFAIYTTSDKIVTAQNV